MPRYQFVCLSVGERRDSCDSSAHGLVVAAYHFRNEVYLVKRTVGKEILRKRRDHLSWAHLKWPPFFPIQEKDLLLALNMPTSVIRIVRLCLAAPAAGPEDKKAPSNQPKFQFQFQFLVTSLSIGLDGSEGFRGSPTVRFHCLSPSLGLHSVCTVPWRRVSSHERYKF